MILKKTDDYTFQFGGRDEILLRNERKARYEVWVAATPEEGDLVWRRWRQPLWYAFNRVAGDVETVAGATLRFSGDGFSEEI